jgi:hypothetical protein
MRSKVSGRKVAGGFDCALATDFDQAAIDCVSRLTPKMPIIRFML